MLLFFRKIKNKKDVAVAVLHTFADQTSVLPSAKFCPVWIKNPDFFLFKRERLFSSFVTQDLRN